MITRTQRKDIIRTLDTIRQDLELLAKSLSKKDDELNEAEGQPEVCQEVQLDITERRLRIESLAYSIIVGADTQFISNIQQLIEDYFNDPTPRAV